MVWKWVNYPNSKSMRDHLRTELFPKLLVEVESLPKRTWPWHLADTTRTGSVWGLGRFMEQYRSIFKSLQDRERDDWFDIATISFTNLMVWQHSEVWWCCRCGVLWRFHAFLVMRESKPRWYKAAEKQNILYLFYPDISSNCEIWFISLYTIVTWCFYSCWHKVVILFPTIMGIWSLPCRSLDRKWHGFSKGPLTQPVSLEALGPLLFTQKILDLTPFSESFFFFVTEEW